LKLTGFLKDETGNYLYSATDAEISFELAALSFAIAAIAIKVIIDSFFSST